MLVLVVLIVITSLIIVGCCLYCKRCDHRYKQVAYIPCEFILASGITKYVPITLYQCLSCGKRMSIRDRGDFYTKTFLKKIKLWERGQCELEDIE